MLMKKAKLFLTALSAFVSLCAFAQNREVHGVVTEHRPAKVSLSHL